MPSKEIWKQTHSRLMQKLDLPCGLKFSSKRTRIGSHTFGGEGCFITVNLEEDFKMPEHLILHEAAHHRHREFERGSPCRCPDWGHCKCWARVLVGMYRETGTPLPQGTQFMEFAKAAGITHRERSL
jgi:hypothetical protein